MSTFVYIFRTRDIIGMSKRVRNYIILTIIGFVLGVGMQFAPHLQGQWGQNVITYMASDLGSWAVISILIATYSKDSMESGKNCFLFMMAMVVGYYLVNPISIQWNLRWIVLGFLMFPIGMFTYWYKVKKWVFLVLEGAMAFFLWMQGSTFMMKITNGKMIVYAPNGDAVFMNETVFSMANYALLIIATIFIMIFMFNQYRKNKNCK